MKPSFILLLNGGSSSIKFTIFDTVKSVTYSSGIVDAIGSKQAMLVYHQGESEQRQVMAEYDFAEAMHQVLTLIKQDDTITDNIIAVGHRVVHGGERFSQSVVITPQVIEDIRTCVPLAPLHNPANLLGIEQAQQALNNIPHVAIFDTAFHHTMPAHAYLYALPYHFYRDLHIRRYGFHGTSHRYITQRTAQLINKPVDQLHLISAHLGNGCSLAAISQGRSVDTTMGLTPLEGLIMGSRCGNIDPSIPGLLIEKHGFSAGEVDKILNHESGLLGISQLSNDMRQLIAAAEEGNQQAKLAIEMFCYQTAKQIAAISVSLPTIDALVFTGGIGEHAAIVRYKVMTQLHHLGFMVDEVHNQQPGETGRISSNESCLALVVPTDEEAMMAQDTLALVNGAQYG